MELLNGEFLGFSTAEEEFKICVGKQNWLMNPIWLQAANLKPLLKKVYSLIHLINIFSEDNDNVNNNNSSKLTSCLPYAKSYFKHLYRIVLYFS